MQFLFVKSSLQYPRSSGHDVHCFEMMRALGEQNASVGLLTVAPPSDDATKGLDLQWQGTFSDLPSSKVRPKLGWLQKKYCSYWGVASERIGQVATLASELSADSVVAVGLDVLPLLAAVENAPAVWYAADEWALHHLSQISPWRPSTLSKLRPALIKGLYERAFASCVDRVWVVSNADRRATRIVMGTRNIDVIPNGVDSHHFSPQSCDEVPNSCVFWGRLDFGPNIDALQYFIRRIWPSVRAAVPDASFSVFGFNPGKAVDQLSRADGVRVMADLPDIRQEICRRQVVVLPFISGAGIKNKLLEAASMGRPIIASNKAMNGVDFGGHHPLLTASRPAQWTELLTKLWSNSHRRRDVGRQAREWVCESHTWRRCADLAMSSIQCSRVSPLS